jgi:hypothetical protein
MDNDRTGGERGNLVRNNSSHGNASVNGTPAIGKETKKGPTDDNRSGANDSAMDAEESAGTIGSERPLQQRLENPSAPYLEQSLRGSCGLGERSYS